MRIRLIALGVGAILAISACAGSSGGQEEGSKPADSATGQSAKPAPVPTSESKASPQTDSTSKPIAGADDLTGYAATTKAWDRQHAEATGKQFAKGAVYDKEKSLGDAVGPYVYTGVTRTGKGRIDSYYRNFPPDTSQRAARQLILQELPRDATVLWERKFDTCIQIEYRSRTLARLAKADADLTDGVSVALVNVSEGGDLTADLGSINSSIVGIGYTNRAKDAPSC